MSVIPRKMVSALRYFSKSQCDSKFTTRSKFAACTIFSTVGSFGFRLPPVRQCSDKLLHPEDPAILKTLWVVNRYGDSKSLRS